MPKTIQCPQCGTEIAERKRYCPECGASRRSRETGQNNRHRTLKRWLGGAVLVTAAYAVYFYWISRSL